jgi:hypothetical protein
MSETNSDPSHSPIIVEGKDITQPHTEWIGKCTPTSKKKQTAFWRGFHIAVDKRNEPGKLYAVCNVCGYVLISHNSGTTNLRRHMKAAHSAVFDKLQEIQESERGIRTIPQKKRSASSNGSPIRQKKPKKARKKVITPVESAEMAQAMYCISANRPFSDLDQPAMKVFVEACVDVGRVGGGFVPNAAVARSKASEAASKAQMAIKEKLREAKDLVLSIDFWENRSNQNAAYISVRWIEGFKLYHCFLNIVKYVGAANEDEIIATVTEDLKKWEIQDDKISYLVSNRNLADNEFCTENEIEFIGCFDFDLQSAIESSVSPVFGVADLEGEATSNEIGRVVYKARKSVAKSTIHNVADGVSRWWSCFAMIESLIENRVSVNSNSQDDSQNALEDEDWEQLQLVKDALTPLSPAMKMLSGNKNCTSSLVPFIQFVVHSEFSNMVKTEGTSKLGSLAKKILKHFENKFGKGVTLSADSKRFLLAHALDPRFKQLKVLADEKDKENLWNFLLEEMVAMDPSSKLSPQESKKKSTDVAGDAAAASILRGVAQKEEAKREETKDSIFDQYAGVLESGPAKDEKLWKVDCVNELKLYRADSTVGMRTENGKEDPLSWWKSHRVAFPTLWKLAQVYLAIPATSTGPRMAFSTQESEIALKRYILSDDLPGESDFLYENSWIMEE